MHTLQMYHRQATKHTNWICNTSCMWTRVLVESRLNVTLGMLMSDVTLTQRVHNSFKTHIK
jgi:hypothetical protein